MFPIYLIPLLLALAAMRVFQKASEDITSILAIATAVICLIGGFVLSPWILKLVITLLVLALERIYLDKSAKSGSESQGVKN